MIRDIKPPVMVYLNLCCHQQVQTCVVIWVLYLHITYTAFYKTKVHQVNERANMIVEKAIPKHFLEES